MKYYGKIGYAETFESLPGVWKERIIERRYVGDVNKFIRRSDNSSKINPDLSINNTISIVSDPYALEHLGHIRYITWMKTRWTVSEITVEPPRLTISLGGLYNGPTPAETFVPSTDVATNSGD